MSSSNELVLPIVDLHSHLPMHIDATDVPGKAKRDFNEMFAHLEGHEQHLLLLLGGFLAGNWYHGEPRVSLEKLSQGGVETVCSVLYNFFDEFDGAQSHSDSFLEFHFDWPAPKANYFQSLRQQLRAVEAQVKGFGKGGGARVVRSWAELQAARAAKAIAVVHCVEGGFALGDTPDHVRENVRAMAEDGIAYVTVAHLLYRQVAANVPPIPSFGILGDGAKADQWCHKHLPVPSNVGLTPLGKVLIEELVRNGIFVDLTHLNTRAMTEALDLMDQLDPGMQIPVLASHGAYRFRSREYNLSAEQVVRVVKRQGTVGVLLCRDFLDDDRGRSPDLGLFCEHLRALAQAISKELPHVDPYAHLGIGTDLDGFIQPLDGVETAGRLQNLARRLKEELPQSAASVCSGSAYSLLSSGARQGKSVGGRVPWAPVPG